MLLAPYNSAEEHERNLSQTVGSVDWLWSGSDELRFDKDTLILQSVWLLVPHIALVSNPSLLSWQTTPLKKGLLQLEKSHLFDFKSTDAGWLALNDEVLLCTYENVTDTVQERFRLRIAQDFDLLIADSILCGWALSHPLRYIISGWEDASLEDVDEFLMTSLRDYLTLIQDPYIERMEDEDPDTLKMLADLRTRIESAKSSTQQKVLLSAVTDVIETFYS